MGSPVVLNMDLLIRRTWYITIAAVVVLSVLPQYEHAENLVNDKVEHLLAYSALGFLPALILQSRWALGIAAVAMIAMGLVLENLQRLVPGRAFEAGDILANTAGVLLGAVVGLAIRRLWAVPAPQPTGE
jgi:VanZ family protein